MSPVLYGLETKSKQYTKNEAEHTSFGHVCSLNMGNHFKFNMDYNKSSMKEYCQKLGAESSTRIRHPDPSNHTNIAIMQRRFSS